MSLFDSRKNADRREHAAHDVVDGGARAQRTAGRARHVGEPRHHLHDLVEGRAMFVRTVEKAFERAIDRARVEGRDGLVAQAQLVHGTGPEILGNDVGRRHKLAGDGGPLGRFHVERYRALVAVEGRKEPGTRGRQAPRIVAARRGLDLDHVGPEIGEDQAAARPHDHVHEFDDAQSGKRQILHHAAAAGAWPFGKPDLARWP
jgi:hypothetical protein